MDGICLTPSDPEYKIWCSEQWRTIIRKDTKAKQGNNEDMNMVKKVYKEKAEKEKLDGGDNDKYDNSNIKQRNLLILNRL
jgi:hypothetical protein